MDDADFLRDCFEAYRRYGFCRATEHGRSDAYPESFRRKKPRPDSDRPRRPEETDSD